MVRVEQKVNDVVHVPPGWLHAVFTHQPCVKLAWDYVVIENHPKYLAAWMYVGSRLKDNFKDYMGLLSDLVQHALDNTHP